jgi:hypothetical protein
VQVNQPLGKGPWIVMIDVNNLVAVGGERVAGGRAEEDQQRKEYLRTKPLRHCSIHDSAC